MQQNRSDNPEATGREKSSRQAMYRRLMRMHCRRQVRLFPPPSARWKRYLPREMLLEYEQRLITILIEIASLLAVFSKSRKPPPPPPKVAAPPVITGPTIDITDMRVQRSVNSGDVVPVFVTVRNYGDQHQDVELRLTDAREHVVIGRRRLGLPAGASKTTSFAWNTRSYKLGDHFLDARATLIR